MAATPRRQVAVVGALAYDQISTTDSRLTAQSQPLLNCKLLSLEEAFGGCGANIAYNLAALDGDCLLATCTGTADDERYLAHCATLGIATGSFLRTSDAYCARALIVTDPDGKQFTGFFPGPVPSVQAWRAHLATLDFAAAPVFVQAPYPPQLMLASLEHATSLNHRPLRIWCPGQYADQLDDAQVAAISAVSDWIVGNAHELEHLGAAALQDKLVIQTNSAEPVRVTRPDGTTYLHEVPAVSPVVDPTGCGDAFIAAIAHHVANRKSGSAMEALPTAISAGNANAAACLKLHGGQRHAL